MRPRTLLFVCLALVLLGLAGASFRLRPAPVPVGDEATHLLMARSFQEDRDFVYDFRDLLRAYRIWNGGPSGVTLLTPDGGTTLRYAEPFAWALAAAPAVALLGSAGPIVLNMALFLGMLAAAWRMFREETGAVGLFLGGFFFASAAFGQVFRGSPEVFLMACVFFSLLLWRRARALPQWGPDDLWSLVLAGALLGAACLHRPELSLLGLAAAVDLAWIRRWKGALLLLVSGALVFGLLAAGQRRMIGAWNPAHPGEGIQRRSFETEIPLETHGDLWQAYGKADEEPISADGPRLLPWNLASFVGGRHTGLIAWFPFALFALGLAWTSRDRSEGRDRSRRLLLAALGVIVLMDLVLSPRGWHGGPFALGNARFAVLYPALLFLPGRMTARRSLVLPYAAAGLWTAAAVMAAIVPAGLSPAADLPTFRLLQLELPLLGGGVQLPGLRTRSWGESVWILPESTFWAEEGHPNGVWMRGASRSEVIVVSPEPLTEIRFFAHSLGGENEMVAESGEERVLVRFDSEAKRNGAPVDLKVEPAAEGLGILPGTSREWVYRFTLDVSDGVVPARRLQNSQDPRFLGVFLDITGGGL